ncbi:MAG: 5'-3' exonuclease H3TH domain-containing protein, partial [Planctomycetota bacterium]
MRPFPMNVHLVDGTYELFRSFYGAPPATGRDGREVGAVRGLLASLLSLLREEGVTHVGIAFDTVIESFRNELFAGYKTGDGIEPALWAQFPLVEQACRALGLVTWSMVEFEADDALATMAVRAAADPRVTRVFVATPDKDLAQVVRGERIAQLDRKNKLVLDAAAVRAKHGVDPESIPDLLALTGDDADGIPGLDRWGMKSAATVLAHYRSLDAIPDDPARWQVPVRGAAALAAVLAGQ